MKKTIKRILFATCAFVMGSWWLGSCDEKAFLDVSNPNVLSPASFPSNANDLDLMLIDAYARTRWGYFNAESFRRIGVLMDHMSDQGYNGSAFNEYAQINVPTTEGTNSYTWNVHYEGIAKCNAFLEGLVKVRKTTLSTADEARLKEMEGQALFIRAFHYFFLINLYGETMMTSEADRSKMGVPIWDRTATNVTDASRERANIGQVWDFIIGDLTKAETLLTARKTWDDANKARVDIWSVKTLLGKSLLFTLQFDKAAAKLKEVIDQSGKKLVNYETFKNMFNGQNEFNTESIFEINFTPDRKDVWNGTQNTSTQYGVFVSPSFLEDDGNEGTNGFGNLFIHDRNLDRFGFTDNTTDTKEMQKKAYYEMSIKMRRNKEVDPRMMIGTLQPWVDSINVYGKLRPVTKNRFEGFPSGDSQAWNHRKYVLIDRGLWDGEPGESIGTNQYFLRLSDVYLMYAEALTRGSGDKAAALEYVNKVHRRAYDQPVDAPSKFDYKTLTDRTRAAVSTDVLANDPLKYERWAEFFGEGHWWLDVCRYKVGAQEQTYYQKVKSGALSWNDRKYALPIPQDEINNNSKMKQNPGY